MSKKYAIVLIVLLLIFSSKILINNIEKRNLAFNENSEKYLKELVLKTNKTYEIKEFNLFYYQNTCKAYDYKLGKANHAEFILMGDRTKKLISYYYDGKDWTIDGYYICDINEYNPFIDGF